MRTIHKACAGFLSGALLFGSAVQAQDHEKAFNWNAGVGLAALAYPRWRGADESESLALPLPTFSVWTDTAQLGRSGISAQIDGPGHWQLRLSLTGSLPVDSEDSDLRRGMEDLDPTLEAGPALAWAPPQSGSGKWRAELLTRGVVTIDFDRPRWLGWTVQPRLVWSWRRGSSAAGSAWSARIAGGPIWAQDKQHDYFYRVRPSEALPDRPAYDAASGYSGTRVNFTLTRLLDRARITGYFSYDNLSGTTFEDSPLRPREHYWLAGAFLSWRLWGPARPLDLED